MEFLKGMIQKVREELRNLITMRLGVLIVSLIFTVLVSGYAAMATIGEKYAGGLAIKLVKPVTDSIKTHQVRTDSTVLEMAKAQHELAAEQRRQARLQEKITAAQRQADPRFDRALRDQIVTGEAQRRKAKENRELLHRLTEE